MNTFYIILNEKFEDGGANITIPVKAKNEAEILDKANKYCKENNFTLKKIVSR